MQLNKNHKLSLFFVIFALLIASQFRFELSGALQANLALIHFAKASAYPTAESFHLNEAERLLREVPSSARNVNRATEKLGFVLLQKGNEAGAVQAWQTVSLDVGQLIAFGKGTEARQLMAEAGTWYRLASEVNFGDGADTFASWLYKERQFEEARDIWQEVLEDYKTHPLRLEWSRGLVRSLVALEQWPTAVQITQQRLNEFPRDAPLLVELGKSLYQVGDINAGIGAIEQAIKEDVDYAQAYAELAAIQAQLGNYSKAFELYSQANQLQGKPEIKWWYVAQANAARDGNQLTVALELYQKINERYIGYAPAYFESAWAYYLLEEPAKAVRAIEDALAFSESPSSNYYIRAGQIYEMNHDVDRAFAAYQQAEKLVPSDQRIQDGLSRLRQQ